MSRNVEGWRLPQYLVHVTYCKTVEILKQETYYKYKDYFNSLQWPTVLDKGVFEALI